MWHALRREGHQVGRDRVARLMRIAGISGAVRGRHRTVTTRRDQNVQRHPDLVKRGWGIKRPDTVWVADFTYVWTYQGFCYVSFITDVLTPTQNGTNVAN
jgi:putative transposase